VDATIERPILLDNTVLTNLALVDRSDLAIRLWPGRVCTIPAVLGEYRAGVAEGLLPADVWRELPTVTLTDKEAAFAASLLPWLGAGERTCLAVAVYRGGLLASDDLDARRVARAHQVPTTGTIGILVLCVRRGRLVRDEANALLARMIALGFRSPVVDLDSLLDEPF
jgi:predicted nucleic acid-binding protein